MNETEEERAIAARGKGSGGARVPGSRGELLTIREDRAMVGAWPIPATDDAQAASSPSVNRRMRREGKLGLRRCALVAQVYSGIFFLF